MGFNGGMEKKADAKTRQVAVLKRIAEAASRARAEAEARRAQSAPPNRQPEAGGRGGLDPVRFGDWEIDGRASDF